MDRMLVVSAYAGKDFFKAVDGQLKPRSLTVVLDEGIDPDLLEEIRGALGKRLDRGGLALGRGVNGRLMHAKLYLLSWKASGHSTLHYLTVGSPNASKAAWGTYGNVESRVCSQLRKSKDRIVFQWWRGMEEALSSLDNEGVVPLATPPLDYVRGSERGRDGLRIHLPSFGLVPPSVPDFDSWLQQGILCHEFRGDPTFIRMRVKLLQPLPVAPELEPLVDLGVIDQDAGKFLVHPYLKEELGEPDEDPEGGAFWHWRSRYFLESTMGWWTSRRCFKRHGDRFKAKGYKERGKEIELAAQGAKHELRIERFLRLMDRVAESLPTSRVNEWLETTERGQLNRAFYRELAESQVRRDMVKARDSSWARRYVNKFEFLDAPRFRADSSAWEKFAASIAETLWFNLRRDRHENVYAQALRGRLEMPEIPELDAMLSDRSVGREAVGESEWMLELLRRRWPELREGVERALEGKLGQA